MKVGRRRKHAWNNEKPTERGQEHRCNKRLTKRDNQETQLKTGKGRKKKNKGTRQLKKTHEKGKHIKEKRDREFSGT